MRVISFVTEGSNGPRSWRTGCQFKTQTSSACRTHVAQNTPCAAMLSPSITTPTSWIIMKTPA